MVISETKKQIVINNYFKNTCDINTSIKEAFTKGFEVGLTKAVFPKDEYEARLKADMAAMLKELKYDLYHELCKEIHGKEDCPCTNQTTSCLATFRVCDANRAIGRVIQQKINELKENKNE